MILEACYVCIRMPAKAFRHVRLTSMTPWKSIYSCRVRVVWRIKISLQRFLIYFNTTQIPVWTSGGCSVRTIALLWTAAEVFLAQTPWNGPPLNTSPTVCWRNLSMGYCKWYRGVYQFGIVVEWGIWRTEERTLLFEPGLSCRHCSRDTVTTLPTWRVKAGENYLQ